MKDFLPILKQSKLFFNIKEDEILSLLQCLNSYKKNYSKGEFVFRQGDVIDKTPLLLEGKLLIQHDDFWGNRNIHNIILPSQIFGESYFSSNTKTIFNDVIASENSTVIFFDIKKLLTVCSSVCKFHTMIIQNLFFLISEKNINLVQKLGYISKRNTRDKILSYLSDQAKIQGNNKIVISFNRQELADFLCINRSAMIKELSKMQKEHLIRFEKKYIELL